METLEDRTVLSAFYDLTTLASTAGGVFTSFGDMPSINNQGNVAFVGNSNSGNGIWMAGRDGQLTNVNPTFTSHGNDRTYGRGVAINDTNVIVARDQLGTAFFVREWNANTPDQFVDLFKHPTMDPNSPDNQFNAAQTFTSINNNGDVAFVLYDSVGSVRDVVKEFGNNIGDGTYTTLAEYDAHGTQSSPRPQLTNNGSVLFVSPTGQLILSDPSGGQQVIASKNTGYDSIGANAAISKDGRVVVFTATHDQDQQLFAAYQSSGAWKIIALAGGGLKKDSFTSFDTRSNLAVNNHWKTDRSVDIVFKGTSALGTGLYSLQLSLFGAKAFDANPINPVSYQQSGIKPVALVDDTLPSGVKITDVALGQGINDVGRGEIAFWAQTDDGAQEIIRANPQQVVWINFSPPDVLPDGATQANLDLFKSVGITELGWEGSMADALSFAHVTLDPIAVQNAIVNAVQQIYTNAGAQVTVLGRSTDKEPEFVRERIDGTTSYSGAFQTIYVGEGAPQGSKYLGLASTPPTAAGVVDFYNQLLDDTGVVFANHILNDGAYGGTPPASLSQAQIVNGIASIIAHESGHNFGLFHLSPLDSNDNFLTHEVMVNGTLLGNFDTLPEFSPVAYPVYNYAPALENVTESSAKRLDYSTGAPNGDPPNPLLLRVVEDGSMTANIGFQGANTLNVKSLLIGAASSVVDALPTFQNLGSGDLATLLNNANLAVDPLGKLIVLGSTDGKKLDIVGVAQGQEGAQTSLTMSMFGLTTDSRLQAPTTGTDAAFHFYKLTSNGAVDLGLAPIQSTPVNHAPALNPIDNQAVTSGSIVAFTAAATDPDAGQILTYSLDPGAPVGAAIDPNTGAFTWTPTAAQAGQVYNFSVRATDNGTPALSAAQPVTINVLNRLQAIAVTQITAPTPGPIQVAIDFNQALQTASAQNVANYKIISPSGVSLPIQSAVYSDNDTQHRVILTVTTGAAVYPGVYHVSINAANLTSTNGDRAGPKADQLWVDVTSENTLKSIVAQPDGSFAVSGDGMFLGYGAPEVVIAGNFAGNGRADLIVIPNGHTTQLVEGYNKDFYDPLLLLTRNEDGTYAPPVPIGFGGTSWVRGIATVDWNHDGSPDLIAGVQAEKYYYYVLLNDGHGSFTDAPDTPIPVAADTALAPFAVYDLTGDGQYEIVHHEIVRLGSKENLEVIGKDPFVGYTPQMDLPIGLNAGGYVSPVQIDFADLNGDGKPDILTRNSGYYVMNPGIHVLLSTPTGYATGTKIISPLGGPVAMGAGSFTDSDQKDIAIVFDNYSNSAGVQDGDVIQVLQNDGKGNFTEQEPIGLNRRDVVSAAFGDVNKDGIPDLVMVLTPSTGQYGSNPYVFDHVSQLSVWTWTSNGHGGFTPTTSAPIPLVTIGDESAPASIELTDLDSDGNLDLLLGSSQFGEVRLALNDGTGTMRPPHQSLPYIGSKNDSSGGAVTGIKFSSYQVYADFNNSGQMGFVAVSPGGLEVYVGQSDGTFRHTSSLSSTFGQVSWAKVGDLNNDSIPDIVFHIVNAGALGIYLGNGDGTFRQAPTFMIQPPDVNTLFHNITLADVNHDGKLDAVAVLTQSDGYPSTVGVFFGDGKGGLTFNANTSIPYANRSGFGAQKATPPLADFNGDGTLDMLVPSSNDSDGSIALTEYLGKGNGTFKPGPIVYSTPQSYGQDLAADLNSDGKWDLVSLNGTTASIYLGEGNGGFQLSSTVDLGGSLGYNGYPISPSNIVIGDFNGDSKLDLATSYYDAWAPSNVVNIYLGDGAGQFAAPQSVTVGTNPLTLASIPRAPFLDVGTFAISSQGPTANDDTVTAIAGSSVIIPVLDNDSNPDQVPLTISEVTSPAHGTAHANIDPSNPGSAAIIYTANRGFTGTDTFTYTIQDSAGVQSTATVTVTVSATASAPVVTGAPLSQTVTAGQSATFTASANGSPSPTVQWQFSTDGGTTFSNISGATSTTLTLNNVTLDMGGYEYRAVFANSAGSATTTAATLAVSVAAEKPVITASPKDQTATEGANVVFTASANGSPTPAVQWQFSTDGGTTFSNISGATSTTLTLNNVSLSTNGNKYQAIFTNSAGSAASTAATLTVNVVTTAPSITVNPTNQSTVVGDNVSFTASGNGNPTPTVQWQISGDGGETWSNVDLPSSTTILLPNVVLDMNGWEVRAVFTNSVGTATTTAATLTVSAAAEAPVITASPKDQTATEGANVVFTASASGSPTPAVQWQVSTDGGTTFSNISGATSTTLTLNNVSLSTNGNKYQAIFTNSAGSVASTAATLIVNAATTAPVITAHPSGLLVVVDQSVTFTAAASGNPIPAVQWQVSTDGGKTFANINGATNTTLTLNNVTHDMDGHAYRAVFTNSAGSAISNAAALTLTASTQAPLIVLNPSSQSVAVGQSVSFTTSASGSPTPAVQWKVSIDGGQTFQNISGATSPTLTLNNVTTSMSGYKYEAVFTNSTGAATSSAATLTVNAPQSPPSSPNPQPSPLQPPTLHKPPLLAFFDAILGAIETVNTNNSVTVRDSLFGFLLFVSNYDSSGNLMNVSLFGMDVTFFFMLF